MPKVTRLLLEGESAEIALPSSIVKIHQALFPKDAL